MLHIKGSMVAIVTPFNQDGSVNFTKLGELVDWQIQSGTDAIVALGTTGESATMTLSLIHIFRTPCRERSAAWITQSKA